MEKNNNEINWNKLCEEAWRCRENAFILGKTKVGACVQTVNGHFFSGCNVEQTYRNHDVHAEVNAISNMVSQGDKKIQAILIVAERNQFTPCGSCLDWIFQFGGENTIVAFQNSPTAEIIKYTAKELMPHYPH